jgi:hypothetical protein
VLLVAKNYAINLFTEPHENNLDKRYIDILDSDSGTTAVYAEVALVV